MIRDETSEAPPGANGTIKVMLRSGQFWAMAEKVAALAEIRTVTRTAMVR
jgi:hypothetical protein